VLRTVYAACTTRKDKAFCGVYNPSFWISCLQCAGGQSPPLFGRLSYITSHSCSQVLQKVCFNMLRYVNQTEAYTIATFPALMPNPTVAAPHCT
jgi:hypothetical protein